MAKLPVQKRDFRKFKQIPHPLNNCRIPYKYPSPPSFSSHWKPFRKRNTQRGEGERERERECVCAVRPGSDRPAAVRKFTGIAVSVTLS